jgi:hypothetical protein
MEELGIKYPTGQPFDLTGEEEGDDHGLVTLGLVPKCRRVTRWSCAVDSGAVRRGEGGRREERGLQRPADIDIALVYRWFDLDTLATHKA